MDAKRRLYWKVAGDTTYLLLMMAVVFFAGREYNSNRKHAWSSLAFVGFSIAGLVWRELTLARNRL
jgi:hydrogenase/urease accessory protein HupE